MTIRQNFFFFKLFTYAYIVINRKVRLPTNRTSSATKRRRVAKKNIYDWLQIHEKKEIN